MNKPDEILWISRVVLFDDRRAFGKLMQRYHGCIRRYLFTLTGDEATSDDLAQTTFIRAWQGLESFKQLSSFSTWLLRIAYTTYCNHLAQTRNSVVTDLSDAVAEIADEPPPEESRIESLRRAVAQLGEGERNCITLFYLEEKSIADIEKITGYKQGTIKSHLSRGREHLREFFNKKDE